MIFQDLSELLRYMVSHLVYRDPRSSMIDEGHSGTHETLLLDLAHYQITQNMSDTGIFGLVELNH
ncbi:MAG: hypothetical protein CMP26_04465 [Roseibacillus sp.]|nr:hypothetical protein [Roseibacillus sp.]